MRIAIVGTGISGLTAAYLLDPHHEIQVYEADDRIGGHTNTVDVEVEGERHAIDTGFIVYNERTYPGFVQLLERLGVETRETEMSFGLASEPTGLEWSSRGLGCVFAQRRNLLRPSFLRMLRDIAHFNRSSRGLLEVGDEKVTLGDYLAGAGYSKAFVDHYVLPMGAAIWSASPASFLEFPAAAFVRFFDNHGLLETPPTLPWRVIEGGSARYLEKLAAPFRSRIRTSCPVRRIRRNAHTVEVTTADGVREFDDVVLAVHSDQALRLLADASDLERRVLGAISYQRNDVVLHTDTALLPRNERAWASWNYRIQRDPADRVLVTYDMNRLQGIASRHRFLVTLNGDRRIDPARVLKRFVYEHPVFDRAALEAQRMHRELCGRRRTHFCGAYWGYGFHEDGLQSALAVGAGIGVGRY